jgi:hypothetical protein
VVDEENGGAVVLGDAKEGMEKFSNVPVVAKVGAIEEGSDGVENDEAAIAVVEKCVLKVAGVAEIESEAGLGSAFGLIVDAIEDVDFAQVSAVSFEAWADDLMGIVFAGDEDDGAFG